MAPWALIAAAWRHRRAIAEAVQEVEKVIEGFTEEGQPHPLTYKDNEHIRRQIALSIAHKVSPAVPPIVDREANTPPGGRQRPPLPPSKRSP
jgi:hypothetical protein